MNKFLLLLSAVIGSFFVVSSASAMTMSLTDWGFNPYGSGYASSLNPIDELLFKGTSFIDNTLNNDGEFAGTTFTELGTFYTTGFSNDDAPVNPDGNINGDYELTAVLNAAGNNVSQTGDDVDFELTIATLNFYIDYTPDYGKADGFYGADSGTDGMQIASFSLLKGGGNLDFGDGDGNADISFKLVSMAAGYFFDAAGVDLSIYDPIDLIIGMTDSNNDVKDPSDLQLTEWDAEGMDVYSHDTNDRWTSTDGSFAYGVVPEPATIMLFGLGLLGFAGLGRRRI